MSHFGMFDEFRGKRVTVMGLGRFGGGIGAARFLTEAGARVTVTDRDDAASLADSLAQIEGLPIERLRLGGHDRSDFCNADLIVASPAVPPGHPSLLEARAAGVAVTTEIGLFWSRCPAPVIAVTGSVGKSTTAAMIEVILASSGRRAWLGGNIGGSLLSNLDEISRDDWVVLELSSFQLEYLASLRPRPAVAVVTNFVPNHLDRHGSLAAYRDAKQNLLRWQTPADVAVLNVGDPDVSTWTTAARVSWFGQASDDAALAEQACRFAADSDDRRRWFKLPEWPESLMHSLPSARALLSNRNADRAPPAVLTLSSDNAFLAHDGREPLVLFLDLRLPGEHHRLNAAAAVAATLAIGVEPGAINAALNAFGGLPHRLDIVGEFDDRLWVNDSKATTPESAIAALRSFDRPIRLIAGGADKGIDLAPLADEIVGQRVSVFLSGQTSATIATLLAERGHAAVFCCETFDESVAAASAASQPGDVILLSPGCASWGQFRDYRERGDRFAGFAGKTGL